MTYTATVVSQSPSLYLRLGETSGTTAADASGNARNGTYRAGGILGVTGLVPGDSDLAWQGASSGSGDIQVPYGSWMNDTALTIVLIHQSSAATAGCLVVRDIQSGTRVWQLARSSAGRLTFTVIAGANPTLTGLTSINDGNAHHIVLTYDGTTAKTYIDGVLDNTGTLSQALPQPTATPITIGNSNRSTTQAAAGTIDEPAVYIGSAWTLSQVQADYNAFLGHQNYTGTATKTLTISTSSTGRLGRSSGATRTLTISATAAARLGVSATATKTLTVATSSAGARGKAAAVAAALTIAATAAGVVVHGGSGTAGPTLTLSASAAGNLGVHAVASKSLTLTPTAAGTHGKTGAATAVIGISATADGTLVSTPHTRVAFDGGLGIAFSSDGGEFDPAYVAPPISLAARVIVAQAIDSVAQDGVRFTPSVRVEEDAYLAHRVLVGGVDVTYFRGIQTPLPTYGLVSPLLYGSGTITFPQIHAAYERPGHGDITWLKKFAPVRVQRVQDNGTVVATDFRGFVSDFQHEGRTLTCTLGGQATGIAALADRPMPIFPRTSDIGSLVMPTLRRYLRLPTANQPATGIRLADSGGGSQLDFLTETLAKSTTKDGKQWAVMPNTSGAYRMFQKDTATIDATVYPDGFRVAQSLRRDFTEEPNRVWAQGVDPDGQRIRPSIFPGLQGADIGFTGTVSPGDSGDAVTALIWRLFTIGVIDDPKVTWTTASDDPITKAVENIQDDANLTVTGIVNSATWAAIFRADNFSLRRAMQIPAAQRKFTKPYLRDATGNITAANPDYNPAVPYVDISVDMGYGFTRDQIRDWASQELADATAANWVGTITVNTGAVIDGEHNPGDPLTADLVRDVRSIKPGMNLWLPTWDGGTLVHVSGVSIQRGEGGGVVAELAVDTRARDTMKVWEVIRRNRESRQSPARQWIAQNRRSGLRDNTGAFYDGSVFGKIPRTFLAANSWTVIPTPAGRSGVLQKIDLSLRDSQAKYGLSIWGREIDTAWANTHLGDPFDVDGVMFGVPYSDHVQRNQGAWQDARWLVDIWGDENQPCGYWPRQHTNSAGAVTDAPITGDFRFTAGAPYFCKDQPVLWVAIRPDRDCYVQGGRVLELLLDDGAA